MPYKLFFENLNTSLNDLRTYQGEVSEKMQEAQNSVTELQQLENFTGQGADSIKSYFSEVHGMCAGQISELAQELLDALADHFNRTNTATDEWNDTALISNEELESKSAWINDFLSTTLLGTGYCPTEMSIYKEADTAKHKAEDAAFYATSPCTYSMYDELQGAIADLNNLNSTVEYQQTLGKTVFTEDISLFARTRDCITQFIERCKDGDFDITTYQSGTAAQIADEVGLIAIQDELVGYLNDQQDNMISCCNFAAQEVINREIRQAEEERRKAEREKSFWDVVGFVAGAIGTAACIGLCVGAAFVSGPVGIAALAGASLTLAGRVADTVERGKNLLNGYCNQELKDASGTIGVAGNTVSTHADMHGSFNVLENKYSKMGKGTGAGSIAGSFIHEYGSDTLENWGFRENEANLTSKMTGNLIGAPASVAGGPLAVVDWSCTVVQDGADYKSAKCQERIDVATSQEENSKTELQETQAQLNAQKGKTFSNVFA